MCESNVPNSEVGKTMNVTATLKKIQRFSTVTFSLVLFSYITLGLIFSIIIRYLILGSILNLLPEPNTIELLVDKLFWYLYQISFITLSLITLLSSIIEIKNKKLWKTLIAWFAIFLSWWAYYGFSAHGIRYSFIY